MAFGLGCLRLSPDAFWRMTPRELAAAMRPLTQGVSQHYDAGAMARLMRDFPDEELNHG